MSKELSTAQKLAIAVGDYEELLDLKGYGLYERLKRRIWKVKSTTERSEDWQRKQLNIYIAGIQALESKEVTKAEATKHLLLTFSPKLRKTSAKKK